MDSFDGHSGGDFSQLLDSSISGLSRALIEGKLIY